MAWLSLSGIGCQSQKQAGPPEKITIAYTINLNSALIHIAFAKNYFGEEGLEASPQPHAFGKPALQALIEGKADIATAADTPVMFALMDGKKINILAVIQTSNTNEAIVARRDRGIAKPSDLQGKIIGVSACTTVDFFADSLLNYYSIDRKNVQIIDLKPEQMAAALSTGKVDAVATWHPTLIQLQKQLGSRVIVFYGESIYAEMFCAVAAQEYVKKNPGAIKKVLRSLLRAEKSASSIRKKHGALSPNSSKWTRPFWMKHGIISPSVCCWTKRC